MTSVKFANNAESNKRTRFPWRQMWSAEFAHFSDEGPRTTTNNFEIPVSRPQRILRGRPPVVVPIKPIRTPFPYVSPHVTQAEVIWRITADWHQRQRGLNSSRVTRLIIR